MSESILERGDLCDLWGSCLLPRLVLTFALVCVCRLEEALSDCIWAQKHMRGNAVIDYKQLGLRFKLYSWQVGQPPSITVKECRKSVSLFLTPSALSNIPAGHLHTPVWEQSPIDDLSHRGAVVDFCWNFHQPPCCWLQQ